MNNLKYRSNFPYTDKLFTGFIESPIKTIVEIGCNKLQYTYDLLHVYNPDVLYAFEAHPNLTEYCKENITDKRIKFIPTAVSDYDGKIDFYGFAGDTGCSSVFERIHLKNEQEPKTSIDCVRLDTFFKDMSDIKIDLLCMDIQGSELIALSGLGEMIKNVSYIILEIPQINKFMHKDAPTYEDFITFFKQNNLEILGSIYENDFEDNVLLKRIV